MLFRSPGSSKDFAFAVFSDTSVDPSYEYYFVATGSGAARQDVINETSHTYTFFFASGSGASATVTNLAAKINSTTTYHGMTANAASTVVSLTSSLVDASTFTGTYVLVTSSNYASTQPSGYGPSTNLFGGGVAPTYTSSFKIGRAHV